MGKKKGRTLGAKVGDLHKKQLLIQQKPSPFKDNASKYTGHKRAYPPSERGPEAFISRALALGSLWRVIYLSSCLGSATTPMTPLRLSFS